MKRSWLLPVACLVVSFAAWLIHNLSLDYIDMVGINVVAASNIEGRAAIASSPVEVVARCKTSGFKLARLDSRSDDRPVTFTVEAEDFNYLGGDSYSVSNANLYKYAGAIFGSDVSVEAFTSDPPVFRFAAEHHRKVPVTADAAIVYHPQYMPAGQMVLRPDSVVVYGDPARVDAISGISTRTIRRNDVKRSIRGNAKLVAPAGIRLSEKETSYTLEIARYVELTEAVRVHARGVPEGVELVIYPNEVEATLRCGFPLRGNPFDDAYFYVDYTEFLASPSGNCIIHASGLGEDVLGVRLSREVCSCVELSELQ